MNREEWLNKVLEETQNDLGLTFNFKYKVSCGFTKRKKNLVEAHPPNESSAGIWEIFVNPTSGKDETYDIIYSLIFCALQLHTGKNGRGCYRVINNYVYRLTYNNPNGSASLETLANNVRSKVGEYPHESMVEQESVTKEKQMYTVKCADCNTSFYINKSKLPLALLYTCACGNTELTVK